MSNVRSIPEMRPYRSITNTGRGFSEVVSTALVYLPRVGFLPQAGEPDPARHRRHGGDGANTFNISTVAPFRCELRRHTHLGQQAREVRAGGVAQQVAVHAQVIAKERLADTAVQQVGAEKIEGLRFLPEGFGIHHTSALSWLV